MFDIYKSTQIGDARTYSRPCQTISISPLDGPNSFSIFEEQIVVLPDGSTKRVDLGTPEIQVTITDPNEAFDIVNPATGAVTGSTTFANLKVLMYSLYLKKAAERDAILAAEAAAALAAQG